MSLNYATPPESLSPVPSDDPSQRRPAFESNPLRLRELLSLAAIVALADVTIYRGYGYAGLALLFAASPSLLLLGAPCVQRRTALYVTGGMLWLLAIRLVWYGSPLQVVSGLALLVAFAAALLGRTPYVLVVLVLASQTIMAGYRAFLCYGNSLRSSLPVIRRAGWLNAALPLTAFVAFSSLFVLANPDAAAFLGQKAQVVLRNMRLWLSTSTLGPAEIFFWIAIAWVTAGLLRPIVHLSLFEHESDAAPPVKPAPAPLYAAYRNTLITVIVLFAGYLVIEFQTLWFREFPDGFYYAGYAHEGAAWLTAALALATLMLSVVFSGRVLHDPRLARMRRLAWFWSLQNLLLSLAVYNRLFIYVGFNGMTRMRIVGLFGISLVVVGFLLVLWKINLHKSFAWLVQRQLWALVVTIYLFALTPVDWLAASYNVKRVAAGDPSASMQIGVQTLDTEGVLALPPLLECGIPEVREGVAALLADHQDRLLREHSRRQRRGWTAQQMATGIALARLEPLQHHWREYEDLSARASALERFHRYAYQWY